MRRGPWTFSEEAVVHRTLRPYRGRTVVVSVDGDSLRGTLQAVGRGAIVIGSVEWGDGGRIDGVVVIPLPTVVQVV